VSIRGVVAAFSSSADSTLGFDRPSLTSVARCFDFDGTTRFVDLTSAAVANANAVYQRGFWVACISRAFGDF
jgi:hypothetical protein